MTRDSAVLLLCAVVVPLASCFEEPRQENPPSFTNCKCKPEIRGRELVASLCHAPTNLGPWFHECIYAKEKAE
jgi:hypothetical protein